MRAHIKLFSLLLFSSVLMFGLGFSSCRGEDDSFGDYWKNIATVNKIGENTYNFTLDSGDTLWVVAPAGLNLKPRYDRAIINYTILSGYYNNYYGRGVYSATNRDDPYIYVRLNSILDVLSKNVIYVAENDKVKQDSIGHDPIDVYSIWEGGDYLNIAFGYKNGGVHAHMLNLVSNQEDLSAGKDNVKLEFRHNNNNDPENYSAWGYVSFNLAPYKVEGVDKVTIEISWTSIEGETKTKTIEYEYNGERASPEGGIITAKEDITNLNIY